MTSVLWQMRFQTRRLLELSAVVAAVEEVTMSLALRDAFRFLDLVDVSNIFQRQASVMRCPPKFICGAFRSAVSVALQEIVRVAASRDEQCRGWKLFLQLQRMLLSDHHEVATSRSNVLSTPSQLSLRVIGSCCCVSQKVVMVPLPEDFNDDEGIRHP